MSHKINVYDIFCGHIKTLCDANDNKLIGDFLTFFLVPIALAILSGILGFNIGNDLTNILVNFGAIFTALLLSVLVLVYDQETKLDDGERNALYNRKKILLNQLYYNISYAIVISIFLVVACCIHSIFSKSVPNCIVIGKIVDLPIGVYLTSPLCILLSSNLVLTILMIVKRMNILLTTK